MAQGLMMPCRAVRRARRAALALALALALAIHGPVASAAANSPLLLSGCGTTGAAAPCGLYLPSPDVRCNGAVVWFAADDNGDMPDALRRTAAGAWEAVSACDGRATACFAGADGACRSPLPGAAPGCATSGCDDPSWAYATEPGFPGLADASSLPRLGTFSLAALPAAPGFACAPSNDAAQCAALGELYGATHGTAWSNAGGWRAAAAGVSTDFCTFKGAACRPKDDDDISWVWYDEAPCAPYVSNATTPAATCILSLPLGFRYVVTACPWSADVPYGTPTLSLQPPGSGQAALNTSAFTIGACEALVDVDASWPVPATAAAVPAGAWTLQQGCAGAGGCAFTARVLREAIPERSPAQNTTAVLELALQWNDLTGTLPGAALGALTTLTSLNVGGNGIGGTIPGDDLARLTALTALVLGTNRLSGTLPAALADLSELNTLVVDTLELSGSVPASFGTLSGLTTFWLRCSGLCGKLPGALEDDADLGLWAREFVPECDCGELRATSTDRSTAGFFCLSPRLPYSRLVFAFAAAGGAATLYGVWRVATDERGISIFVGYLRRFGCGLLADAVARNSPSRRAARKLQRAMRAQQAAAKPATPLRELQPEQVVNGAKLDDGTHVRVRTLCAPLEDVKLLAEARALCAAAHANVLAPLAIVPPCGWLLYPAAAEGAAPLEAFLSSAGPRLGHHAALRLAADVAIGLAFLHAQRPRLLHGRLRCAAVEVEHNAMTDAFRARIIDAGLLAATPGADVEAVDEDAIDAEVAWHAPELDAGAASAAGDVFALGTLLWQIFHPTSAPRGLRPRLAMRLPARLRNLVTACWEARPAERMLAAEVACALEREYATRSNASGALGSATLKRLSSLHQELPTGPLPECPRMGLSLAGLKAFMKQHAGREFAPTADEIRTAPADSAPPVTKRFEELSTTEVVQRIIKPMTAARQCTYVELMQDATTEEGWPLVATANVFVSHAWNNIFADTAAAVLARLDGHADAAQVYLWNDIFVGSQHKTEELPQSWWTDAFSTAIKQMGRTLLVLQPWAAPLPLTRAWCLWEIFSTLDSASDDDTANNKPASSTSALGWHGLHIALPPREEAAFQEALAGDGFDDILCAVNAIDARNAKAYKANDRELIKAAVVASPGGFEYVNGEIKRRLGAWLLRSGQDAVARAHQQPAVLEHRLAALSTAANLSRLLRDRHEHALAFEVEDKALEASFQLRRELRAAVAAEGKRSETAAVSPTEATLLRVSRIQASMLVFEPGGANRAVARLRPVVARERTSAALGPTHKDTLDDMKALADALVLATSHRGVLDAMDRCGLRGLVRRVLRPARKWAMLLVFRRHTDEETLLDVFCVLAMLPLFPLFLVLQSYDEKVTLPAWQATATQLYQQRVASLASSPELAREHAQAEAQDKVRRADVLKRQRCFKEAETLYEEALAALMAAHGGARGNDGDDEHGEEHHKIGAGHHKTLACAEKLAHIWAMQGRRSTIVMHFGFPGPYWRMLLDQDARRAKLAKAEELLRGALSHARNRLGAPHPQAVELALDLAACLQRAAARGDAHVEASLEAAALCDSVMDALTDTLGPTHARTVAAQKRAQRIESFHERENLWVALKIRQYLTLAFLLAVYVLFFVFLAVGSSGRYRDPWLNTASSEPACPPVQ